jgi:hypothetical protein
MRQMPVCYSEIMAMCKSEADIGVETVDYLFANKAPIHHLRDRPIGNVDLVMMNFVKALKKRNKAGAIEKSIVSIFD